MPERKRNPQSLEEKNAQLLQELQSVRREPGGLQAWFSSCSLGPN